MEAPLQQQIEAQVKLVAQLSQTYQALRRQHEPAIAGLQSQADALAVEFKALVAQAPKEYAAGNKALAKQLSNRRKELQAQSEQLNAQANELRRVLDDARHRLNAAEQRLQQLRLRLSRQPATGRARVAPAVSFVGFDASYGISAAQRLLARLAPAIRNKIGRVEFVRQFHPHGLVGLTTSKEKSAEWAVIYLYLDISSLDPRTLAVKYVDTLTHECGHVMFDRCLNAEQRWEWGRIYNATLSRSGRFISAYASESLREDFSESFRFFIRKSSMLYKQDPERYAFINKVYKELQR